MTPKLLFVIGSALLSLSAAFIPARAQGTGFSYQGLLKDGGTPANGLYELRFSLFGSEANGTQIGDTVTKPAVVVSNGLFNVTLDFGTNFPGADRWLEIAVRSGSGGPATTLSPRQPLTPVPYAITASTLSGPLPASQLSGALASGRLIGSYSEAVAFNNPGNNFSGLGAGLTGVNAATLNGLAASEFWLVGGNAGTVPGPDFLGTIDNSPLELAVNGQRAFRLEPTTNAPNVIGGFSGNAVKGGATGVTIGGGGMVGQANFVDAYAFGDPVIAYGAPNFATIAGGSANQIVSGEYSSIGGGINNAIVRWSSFDGGDRNTIGAGSGNVITDSSGSTISGGQSNKITGVAPFLVRDSTIGGGLNNSIYALSDPISEATIAGGSENSISSFSHVAVISGGTRNTIGRSASGTTIAGGARNEIASFSGNTTISGGAANSAQSQFGTIGGGGNNRIGGDVSTIGGGGRNTIGIDSPYCVISGGVSNLIALESTNAIIGGGKANVIETGASSSTVGGGIGNVIRNGAQFATIPGGASNEIGGSFSFAAGKQARALQDGDFVWADASSGEFASTSSNQFLIRAKGGVGINTNDPSGMALAVAGDARVTGLVRAGSEAGTSEVPDKGLLTRRIRSSTLANGSVVARTDVLTLERDGTHGGWRINYPAFDAYLHIACMGVSSTGEPVNFASSLILPNTPGTITLYSDAQNVVYFRCSFGNGYDPGHLTEVSLTRFPGDIVWTGSLTSTYNQ